LTAPSAGEIRQEGAYFGSNEAGSKKEHLKEIKPDRYPGKDESQAQPDFSGDRQFPLGLQIIPQDSAEEEYGDCHEDDPYCGGG
jgi:hypothetical protein